MTLNEARKIYQHVKVHAPELSETMTPTFRLIDMTCHAGKNGECWKCKEFMGVDLEPHDGVVSCFGVYEGFCKIKESE